MSSGSFKMFSTNYPFTDHIGIMVKVFANGPGDLGSIPGRVIQET